MKMFLCFLSTFTLIALTWADSSIEKVEVKVLDPTKGKCSVKINPGPPRSVDIDVESMIDAKDIEVSFTCQSCS